VSTVFLPSYATNEGLEPTPSSVRCAPASGRGSGLAFGVKRTEAKTKQPFRLGNCTAQHGEGTWQTVRQDHPSRKWQT